MSVDMSRWHALARNPYFFSSSLFFFASLIFLVAGIFASRAVEAFDPPLADLTNRIFVISYGMWLTAIGCAILGTWLPSSSALQAELWKRIGIALFFATALLVVFVPGTVCRCAPTGISAFVHPYDYLATFVWIPPNLLATMGLVSAGFARQIPKHRWQLIGGFVWNAFISLVATSLAMFTGDAYYGSFSAFVLPGVSAVGYCLIAGALLVRDRTPPVL